VTSLPPWGTPERFGMQTGAAGIKPPPGAHARGVVRAGGGGGAHRPPALYGEWRPASSARSIASSGSPAAAARTTSSEVGDKAAVVLGSDHILVTEIAAPILLVNLA
jgi:hypothetical protein